jgi:hypothetical protein
VFSIRGFEGNKGWLELLRESHEVEELVGVNDVRGTIHAAGAKLRVFKPFDGEGLLADLA